MARVFVAGDIHAPATHPGYLAFCADVCEQWRCDKIVSIGDIVDLHAISFHAKDIKTIGTNEELEEAAEQIEQWYEQFPRMDVMIGNHDERVYRLAASVNIPPRFIRDYSNYWGTPKWRWMQETFIDGVHYFHGTGCSGKTPALNRAIASMVSTVIGHVHSSGGVLWTAGPTQRVFGMDTGCGVDCEHPAMNYGKTLAAKPVLSCGVVIDGVPYHEIMPCGPGEPYHRSRFKKRKK